MEVYYDIIQESTEWQTIRYGKIGGTSASQLFTKGDALLDEILAARSEEFEPTIEGFVSNDMQLGIERQPLALEKLSEYTKIKFIEVGWLQCEENELLGISPDGISDCFKYMAEIKCPGAKKHLQTIKANEIPLDNIHQCLHAFTVNPFLERFYFCSYRPENKFKSLFVKELGRDSEINIGTKANPVKVKISEAIIMAENLAAKLKNDIDFELEKLSF